MEFLKTVRTNLISVLFARRTIAYRYPIITLISFPFILDIVFMTIEPINDSHFRIEERFFNHFKKTHSVDSILTTEDEKILSNNIISSMPK